MKAADGNVKSLIFQISKHRRIMPQMVTKLA